MLCLLLGRAWASVSSSFFCFIHTQGLKFIQLIKKEPNLHYKTDGFTDQRHLAANHRSFEKIRIYKETKINIFEVQDSLGRAFYDFSNAFFINAFSSCSPSLLAKSHLEKRRIKFHWCLILSNQEYLFKFFEQFKFI